MRFTYILLLFSVLFTATSFGQTSRDWEYQPYPELTYELEHVVLNLTVEPENAAIKGIARYDIRSRRQHLSQVVMHTSKLEIQDVSHGGEKLEYQVSGDSLIVQLSDTLQQGNSTQLHISWSSNSTHGIHTDENGHMWTSLNPKTIHHWFPVYDHPEVETTFDAYFTLPAEMDVAFNGRLISDEITSANEKKVHWKSEVPVPVTGLSAAIGSFTQNEAISGIKEVRFFADDNNLLKEVQAGLLRRAVTSLKDLERKLSFEYPYESLSIIVLPDHTWNEIQAGAGIIYLYQDLGNLSVQLDRGIAAQWLGQHHRYLSPVSDARNYELLRVALLGETDITQLKNPVSLKSVQAWNEWAVNYAQLEDEFFRNTVEESIPEMIKRYSGVMGWDDYVNFWYRKTGSNWKQIPDVQSLSQSWEESYAYEVEYIYDEMNASLQLAFQAEDEAPQTLLDITVTEVGFSDTTMSKITITGLSDSADIDLSTGTEYIILSPETDLDVKLTERKPFYFLLNQLRSSKEIEREEAARGLIFHTDQPDLQLALRDALNSEESPKVRAALLETLAPTMQSATGTEETFLSALRTDNPTIRLAAIRSLALYPGNENVSYAVRNALVQSKSDSLFNTALDTYSRISATGDLISISKRYMDSHPIRALQILQAAAPEDTTGQVVEMADQFTGAHLPYSIRKDALELLISRVDDAEYWQRTLPALLNDADARIRYQALKVVEILPQELALEMLNTRESEEFDPRVLKEIRHLSRAL